MRTRSSNRLKRPTQQQDYGISTDSDAAEGPNLSEAKAGPAGNSPEGEDNSDSDVILSDGEGDVDGDEDGSSDEYTATESEEDQPASSPAGGSGRRRGGHEASSKAHIHDIPPFPQDDRGIRSYSGPLKRWGKYPLLIDVMYGPDVGSLQIIDTLRRRWAVRPVLPVKSPDADEGVLRTPWVPDGFEAAQEKALHRWFAKYHQAAETQRQRSHTMEPGDGRRRLRGSSDGHVVAFVGPAACQRRVDLSPGKPIALRTSGVQLIAKPAENETSSAGWMFDVGGIPLSMAWAPARGDVGQILALAVVPHEDQALPQASQGPAPSEAKDGCVQFWQLPHIKDSAGIVRPSRELPQLSGAICFDWGRPKRLQWCPVALRDSSSLGLLAILCSDGQVHVCEVARHESTSYGNFPFPSSVAQR